MENNFNISELVCTRISHDLIGNIGAFSNAMELLEDDDNDANFVNESLAMLKHISSVLSARLKFFRLVFGVANSNLEKTELVEKTAIEYLDALNPNTNIALSFCPVEGKCDFNRVLLLAVMIGAEVLIKSGKIYITAEDGCIKVKSVSEAPLSEIKIKDMQNLLNGEKIDNQAQYVALYYLKMLGAQLDITFDKDFCLTIK